MASTATPAKTTAHRRTTVEQRFKKITSLCYGIDYSKIFIVCQYVFICIQILFLWAAASIVSI
jgi:hypothetical protein